MKKKLQMLQMKVQKSLQGKKLDSADNFMIYH